MAFTFQVNKDIKFVKNEDFLKKYEDTKIDLIYHTITDYNLCELKDNPKIIGGKECVCTNQPFKEEGYSKDEAVIIDFKEHNVGNFQIDIDSIGSPMDAPLYIEIMLAEIPAELEGIEPKETWLATSWIQKEYIHLDTLPTTLKLPRRYSFRYVQIKVLGISNKYNMVLSNPQVISRSCVDISQMPVPSLGDKKLEQIYQVGLKTLAECMQEVYEDGPKRDQRLWLGDLRLQALSNYASFKDLKLVKRCLYLFGYSQTTTGKISANVFTNNGVIPDDTFLFDYSLFFTSTLKNYFEFSNDLETLLDLYPVCIKNMDMALKRVKKDYVEVDSNYPVFIDWSQEFDKYTCMVAVMIYTLKDFIALGEKLSIDMKGYQKKLKQLIAISDSLYNKEEGLYESNGQFNIASQVWMVLANIKDLDFNRTLILNMINKLFPVQNIATPYMYHHITEAMFQVGLDQLAIGFMKNYWGMMVDLGADTFFEAFDPNQPQFSPYGSFSLNSFCHAWSCTPVYLIHKYILKDIHVLKDIE